MNAKRTRRPRRRVVDIDIEVLRLELGGGQCSICGNPATHKVLAIFKGQITTPTFSLSALTPAQITRTGVVKLGILCCGLHRKEAVWAARERARYEP